MFITTTLKLGKTSARIICKKNTIQLKFVRLFTDIIGTSDLSKAQEETTVKYLRYDSTEVHQELAVTKYLRYDSSGHDSSGVFCEVLQQDKLIGVQCIITAKMRAILSHQLQFSNEDISQMTPQFAAEIIEAEWKKELGTSDEDMKCLKDYYGKYSRLPCGSIGYKKTEKTSLSTVKEPPIERLYLLR
mmetsp:Transcript_29461/g.28174  ORF Transcript_29461/g.28174 Transcript_29461/m.28174 type:complete len:188 (+) Transcript_29461:154-717(+)